jgi:hypothetical protein
MRSCFFQENLCLDGKFQVYRRLAPESSGKCAAWPVWFSDGFRERERRVQNGTDFMPVNEPTLGSSHQFHHPWCNSSASQKVM